MYANLMHPLLFLVVLSRCCVLQVTLIVYLGALISFVGWFLFTIYVSIGMVALPLDCFK